MIATQVSRPIRSASASGPKRVVEAELRDRVDRLGLGDAVVERPDGLVDERHQDPVRDEAGKVVRHGRCLAQLAGQLGDRLGSLVGRVAAPNDLDQRHHGHGVEEVHPDHAVGATGRRGEGRDRYRGRVRREDRAFRERRVGTPKDVLLDVGVLDDGLDHQVGRHEVLDGLHPPQDLVRVGPALLRQLAEALAHGLDPAIDGAGLFVVERDATARGRHDLCDPSAHLPRADNENVLEAHAREATRRPGRFASCS